jgi:hypothetical protein
MKVAREALAAQGLVVKFECTDGDAGHNQSHRVFFSQWYGQFLEKGSTGTFDFAAGGDAIPVGDFLHLLKTFLKKVKNHLVVMSPDCLETPVSVADLESVLHLGRALSDKSSVGRMRDSYALQLFSIANCLKCLETGHENGFMFMLRWALQEEVIRAPELSREERLIKAVLRKRDDRRPLCRGFSLAADLELGFGFDPLRSSRRRALVFFSNGNPLFGELLWARSSIVPGR